MNNKEVSIENEHYLVKISYTGAELKSVFSKDLQKELLWQANPEFWPRHAPILFPMVGKLNQGRFRYLGKEYEQPQHGFARDQKFDWVSGSTHSAQFVLKSTGETFKNYPFNFELYITYTINQKFVEVQYEVKNQGSDDMWFSIGGHPGFICPMFQGESIDDYKLVFEKEEAPEQLLLNNGLIADVQSIPSFTQILLSEQMFENDAVIFKNLQSSFVDLKNKTGFIFRFQFNRMPYLAFWKKPHAPFICIEPWHGVADNIGFEGSISEKTGIETISSHQMFTCSYRFGIV